MEEAIVFYAPPMMGHIVAMAELAKLIRHYILRRHPNRRLTFTIMYGTDPFEPPSTASALSKTIALNPSISFLHLPIRPVDTSPTRSRPAVSLEAIRNSAPDAAAKLRSISACLALNLHMPEIDKRVRGRVFKDSPDLLIEIPGLPGIPATEMPEALLDNKDQSYKEVVCLCQDLSKLKGIMVNTFDELEPVTMEAVAGGACLPDGPTPPVYNIGPLIEASNDSDNRHESLSWLDSQPSRSVVFLCFGSRGRFTAAQTKEIAGGLERSGQRFIWVVRNPPGDNSEEVNLGKLLPDGFLERTESIGIVIKGWAPQGTILGHDSVGGFVTHCGWNSVLEAVVAGKPMVAWPLYSEQHVNRAALVKTMGMAIPVQQRGGDWFVTGEELAGRLTELMASEKGKHMKEKSEAMKAKAIVAQNQGGSSMAALEKVVNTWMEE